MSEKEELDFRVKVNLDEARRNIGELMKLIASVNMPSIKIASFDSKAMTAFQEARIAATKTLLNAQLASEKLRQENLLLDADLKSGIITAEQAAAATKANTLARQELVRSTKEGRLAQAAANESYEEANRKLLNLGRSIKAAEGGVNSTNPAIRAQIQEYNLLNNSLKDVDTSLVSHQTKVGNYGAALNGIIGSLSGMAAEFLSVPVILQYTFDTALKTDAIRTSLEFTFNSTEIAQTKMEGLQNTARRLGLEYTSLADSYRSFAGAAIASNFSLKETDKIFDSIANAGAKLKLTPDQVSGVFTAFQEMISKSTVQSDELSGQLSERLPGAFAIAARAMGVPQKELEKLMEDGKVTAEELLPKLAIELDKTFSNDKTEKVTSLQGEVNNLKNSLTEIIETKGAISGLFTFIIGLVAKVTHGVAKFSEGLGILYEIIFNGQKFIGDKLRAANFEAIEQMKADAAALAKDVPKKVNGKSGLYDRLNNEKIALRDLTKEYEKAKTEYEKIKPGDRSLADGLKFQEVKDKFNRQLFFVKSLRKEYDNLYGKSDVPKQVEDTALKSVKAIQTRINELKKLDGSAIVGSDIYKRIEVLQGRVKKPKDNGGDAELKEANALSIKLQTMHEASVRGQKESSNAELDSVKDKYSKISKEVDDFYAKNKNKNVKINIDGQNVSKSQVKGIIKADLERDKGLVEANQAIDATKLQIETQKQLFEEYEQYKTQFGEEEAEKRFASDLGKYRTFVKYAKSLIPEDSDQSVLGNKKRNLINNDVLPKAKKDDQKLQQQRYSEAYAEAITYSQKIIKLDEEYEVKRRALGETATSDQIANLQKQKDAKLRALNEENAFAKSGYADLMERIDALTRGKAIESLNDAKSVYERQYKAKLITAREYQDKINMINAKEDELNGDNIFRGIKTAVERYKKAKETFEKSTDKDADPTAVVKAKAEMFNKIGEGAHSAAKVVDELSASLGQLGIGGEQLQKDFKNISGILSGAGDIAKGIATGNPVDIVTGSIKLLTNAIEIFNVKDKRLNKQIKGYQEQLESLGRSYKQLERDVNNSVGESIYSNQGAQIENLKKQQEELIKMRNAENDKKKTDDNKVKEYQAQIDAIPGQIEDIEKSISQNLIQGTFRELSNSLADALSEAFKAGEDGIDKMDGVFNNFIGNAIKNSLKLKLLDPIVSDFTEQLTQYAKENKNSVVGFDFEKWREKLKEAGELFNAGLQGSEEFFKDLSKEPEKKTGISGSIVGEALKEDTANRMLGLQQGQYDLTKQIGLSMGDMLQIGRSKLAALEKIAANTLRGADNTDGVGQKLDKIIENTSKTSGSGTSLDQALRDSGVKI